jgi:CHAT domain-containing protein/tetratricopeptide (TPR) repeat protein
MRVPANQLAQDPKDTKTARQQVAAVNDQADTVEGRRAALATLEEATRLFLDSNEKLEAARTLYRIGRLHLLLNEPKKAIVSHNTALKLLLQTPSDETEVDNLNGLGAAYVHLNTFELAEPPLQRALTRSQRSNYKVGQAEALLTLSQGQNFKNHIVALETAQKALALSEALGDKTGIARTYTQIGECYTALHSLDDSKQSYQSALALWIELRNPEGQASALIAMGFIEYRRGDWEKAISFHTEAAGLLTDKSDPMKLGQVAIGLGEAFIASGTPETGLTYYKRGLEYYRQTQKPDYISYAIWGIGRTNYLLGNYTEAIKHLQSALDLETKDSIQAALCHMFLARVYLATGEYGVALDHLKTALPIYERTINPKEVAQVRGLMGQVYQQQGDSARARQYYKEALDIFARLNDNVNLAVIYFALGGLELKHGNLDESESLLRKSIEVTENMRRISTSSDLTAAFSATVHDRYESYAECLMRKHYAKPGDGFDVRAFETSEVSRGRALVDVLQATRTVVAPGLDPHLAEQEQSLRQTLRVKADLKVRLLATSYKNEDLIAVESEIAQLDTRYKKVLETIQARYPSFEQINRPTGWDLRQIQEKVVRDDETLLIEYLLGEERSYVWAVTRDRITSYELPSESVIDAAAKQVYRLLATAPTAQTSIELDQASLELSKMVLAPIAHNLNKRRILLVADGALNYIPFQTLLSPSDNGQQLVANHEVINAPSASILGQLRQETGRRQPAAYTLAAFGDPVFAANYAQSSDNNNGELIASDQIPNNERKQTAVRDIEINEDSFEPSRLQPLFYAKHELANLRGVAGNQTLLATRFDASRQKLQQTDLTKFAVLHFATHGVLNPKRLEKSGLFLSTVNRKGETVDGFVRLSDIYNLHAPVDLVVLSACRTGLGKDVRGEGIIGITRGFMYAGASSVVASLWKVDDEATAELMKLFYTNLLKGGMTPAAALSAAQKSIRQQERWRSPYYWAAFTLQGDNRAVINRARNTITFEYENLVALGSLLVLAAIVGWSYRRNYREVNR